MGADEGSPTEIYPSHPVNLGWDGRVYPRRAFPRDGPVPLRRTGVLAPPSGPATGKPTTLRGHRLRPTLFNTPTLRTLCASDLVVGCCVSCARRKFGWAGRRKVRNANSTHAAHRRALSLRMACTSIRHRGRTSARLAGAVSGSALAAPLPFAVRSRPTADGRRQRADFCRWPYIRSVGCVPTPGRLCRVLLAFLFELPVWRCRRHRRV